MQPWLRLACHSRAVAAYIHNVDEAYNQAFSQGTAKCTTWHVRPGKDSDQPSHPDQSLRYPYIESLGLWLPTIAPSEYFGQSVRVCRLI